jgi:hypothetical protein
VSSWCFISFYLLEDAWNHKPKIQQGNKLPQNMGSDHPLMQHRLAVEWKPPSKSVRTAEF